MTVTGDIDSSCETYLLPAIHTLNLPYIEGRTQ